MPRVHFCEASRRGKDGLHRLMTAGGGVMSPSRPGDRGAATETGGALISCLPARCLTCLPGRCVGLRRVIKIRGSQPRVSRECLRQAAVEEEGQEEEERQQGR